MFNEKPITIFVVDDNKMTTLALEADIKSGFENKLLNIQLFTAGDACIQKFIEDKPQIVILDYHLNSNNPKTADGIKILDRIKKESEETYVIMLTGDDHIDIAIKAFKHGAADYIVKSASQSQKLKYSLVNIFKMMEAKGETKRYQRLLIAVSMIVGLMIGGFTAVQLVDPTFFR